MLPDERNDSGDSPTPTESAGEPLLGNEDAVPVCLKCMTPHSQLQHYCENCGTTVGQLTPYLPYEGIPYNYSIFGTMWGKLWAKKGTSIGWRIIYLFLLGSLVPIMFVGLPFALISKLRRNQRYPDGHCQACGYNLTGNVSGICPECGTKVERP